jgi:hypothetical protein
MAIRPRRDTGARALSNTAAVTTQTSAQETGFQTAKKAAGFKLSSTTLRRMAAAGLASAAAAAAALLYKKSQHGDAAIEEEVTSGGAPAAPSKQRRTAAASRVEAGPGAPARIRKKRSDAGVKRGSRTKGTATASPPLDQPLVKLEDTVTSAIALTAGSSSSDQSADRAEALAEAHPS